MKQLIVRVWQRVLIGRVTMWPKAGRYELEPGEEVRSMGDLERIARQVGGTVRSWERGYVLDLNGSVIGSRMRGQVWRVRVPLRICNGMVRNVRVQFDAPYSGIEVAGRK